jgi:FkbM family methyltransferase
MKSVPQGGSATVLSRLAGSLVFHRAVKLFRVQRLAHAVLSRLPIVRTFGAPPIKYRLQHLESFLLADEIFQRKIYEAAFDRLAVSTFVDLGCNVGYFVCYAAQRARGDVIALAVDGDATMVAETRWHVAANQLAVTVDHGAAGFPEHTKQVTFFVNPSNVASSAQPALNPNVPAKGDSRPVTVPAVHVHKRWRQLAGDRRIDLLKIDIEGTECELLRVEPALLAITDRIVIEWHKWTTTLAQVEALLAAAGFARRTLISEDEHAGVAVFDSAGLAARLTDRGSA